MIEKTEDKVMKPKITDITPAIKSSVNAVLMAKAFAQIEREKIDAMDRDILLSDIYLSAPSPQNQEKARITKPQDSWLLCDADAKTYYAVRDFRIKQMGYDLKPGHCPALIAESVLSDARHLLVEVAKPVFGVDLHDLLRAGMDKYYQYIDLLCKLVVNAPDFENPLKI